MREVYETDDMSTVPQMWAMYKEVAEYYQKGVRVPLAFTGSALTDPAQGP